MLFIGDFDSIAEIFEIGDDFLGVILGGPSSQGLKEFDR